MHTRMLLHLLVTAVFLMFTGHVLAQQPDDEPLESPSILPITPGSTVQDTITEAVIFDWWLVTVREGDTVQVTMTGQDGLAPLLGILDPEQNLVERSADGNPNDTVTMSYTAATTGEYRIVATRTGNADGTTVGPYTLSVDVRGVAPTPEPDPYREVIFDCNGEDVPNALVIEFEDDPDQATFVSLSVYGLDGFQPAVRTTLRFDFEPFFDQFCETGEGAGPGVGLGDRLTMPGEDPLTLEGSVPKVNFENISQFGIMQLNIAALNETSGRYVIVIDGLTIGPDGDRDLMQLGLGPLAQEAGFTIYQVGSKSTRLDPNIQEINADIQILRECDDAGAFECEDVPTIDGFEWFSSELETTVDGGRFDAGLRFEPGSPDMQSVLFGSFDGRTSGDYTVVIVGEFPPRE
ncbi:MAG: hypothetical protein AAF787_04300 [Chloroflexota bacterium]